MIFSVQVLCVTVFWLQGVLHSWTTTVWDSEKCLRSGLFTNPVLVSSNMYTDYCPPPAQRAGAGLLFLSASCVRSFVHLFVRSFDTLWFPDSHSWTKPYRMFLFGTKIDPIKTLLGIIYQVPWPIFDLVITYFMLLELVSGL